MQKIVLLLIILCLAAASVLIIYTSYHPDRLARPTVTTLPREWPHPLEGVDLEPRTLILTAQDISNDNAFALIRQLGPLAEPETSASSDLYDQYVEFKKHGYERGRYPALEAWFYAHTDALRIAYDAADMDHCQVATVTVRNAPQPYLTGVAKVSEMLRFGAEKSARSEGKESVIQSYRTILRLGNHITHGGTLSNYHVNMYVTAHACESMRRLAYENQLDVESLRELARLLGDVAQDVVDVAESVRYEYVVARSELLRLYQGEIATGELPLEKAENYLNALFSHLVVLAGSRYNPARYQRQVGWLLQEIQDDRHDEYDRPERLAFELMEYAVPQLEYPKKKHLLHLANLRATATALALHAYRKNNGDELPESLQQLVPDYLDEIPVDPFSSEHFPLRYERGAGKHWKIYSIGPNEVDEGGATRQFQFGYFPDYKNLRDVTYSSYEFVLP